MGLLENIGLLLPDHRLQIPEMGDGSDKLAVSLPLFRMYRSLPWSSRGWWLLNERTNHDIRPVARICKGCAGLLLGAASQKRACKQTVNKQWSWQEH
jgi:hypothetical protein